MEKLKYQTISTVTWVALLVHSTNLPRGPLKYNDLIAAIFWMLSFSHKSPFQ